MTNVVGSARKIWRGMNSTRGSLRTSRPAHGCLRMPLAARSNFRSCALLARRQPHPGQPEIVNTFHQALERVPLGGLSDIAVRLQFVALGDVGASLRN